MNLEQETVLLATNAEGTRLLPFTLEDVEALIKVGFLINAFDEYKQLREALYPFANYDTRNRE